MNVKPDELFWPNFYKKKISVSFSSNKTFLRMNNRNPGLITQKYSDYLMHNRTYLLTLLRKLVDFFFVQN